MMPAITFSNVLLPAPLRPTIPKVSPGATVNEMSRSGQNVSIGKRSPRTRRIAYSRIDITRSF